MTEQTRIAIIGCGTMGEAILGGVLAADVVHRDRVVVTSRRKERIKGLVDKYGVHGTTSNVEAVADADIVLLCVKPQVAREVLQSPGVADSLSGKLLVSIAAAGSAMMFTASQRQGIGVGGSGIGPRGVAAAVLGLGDLGLQV